MGKGTNGVLMKLWRAKDFTLQVTSVEAVTDRYLRIGFAANGLLDADPVHPTQWIRLWVPEPGSEKLLQRGYTLVDQDPENDRFAIEFALHGGPASRWAETAKVGDSVEASILGSDFRLPEAAPSEYVIFGDTASLPAVNSLLDAIGDTPAQVWLEWQDESEPGLPVRNKPHHRVTWLQRVDDGRLLREKAEEITCAEGAFGWVACCGRTTRSIVKSLKTTHGLPKTSIKSRAYWK